MIAHRIHQSAPYLAVFLLFGLLFGQALAYFIDISWRRSFTIILYTSALTWLALLLLQERLRWWAPRLLDFIVICFWLIVGASSISSLHTPLSSSSHLVYIPFMALLPYLCGRLIRPNQLLSLIDAITYMGLLIVILVLTDRFTTDTATPDLRRPIFGFDHGRLMVGALLASAFPLACFYSMASANKATGRPIKKILTVFLPLLFLMMLMATTARGWLISGLAGAIIILITQKNVNLLNRLRMFIIITITVLLTHFFYQAIDQHYSNFERSQYINLELKINIIQPYPTKEKEIIGLPRTGCQSHYTNSISVRSLLYQESIAMFLMSPFFGVGAGRFGDYSCWTDSKAYPHSTILHVLSELGILGAIVYLTACLLSLSILFLEGQRAFKTDSDHVYNYFLALLIVFLISDQVYGSYVLSSGSWFLIGISAGIKTSLAD